ncbi:MAG: response regulator, partial [bacterium]
MKQSRIFPRIESFPGIRKDSLKYWNDGPARILIVDDEEGIREPMKEFLKSLGYQVFTSPEPFQALEIVKGQFIHLVIQDLCMPGMDGIELQKRILVLSPDTKIIIITGFESLDSALKTLKAGAYDYLTKPIRFPTLENDVRHCLDKQKLELENRHLLEQLKQTCGQLKEREEALEAKAAEVDYYLNNILEKANDIIFTLDINGHFTYVNPKIEALGYNRDSLMTRSFFALLSEKTDAALIDRSIKMEKPEEWEVSLKDNNGKKRNMIISTSPIYDEYFGLAGVLGIARDITHQSGLLARIKEDQKMVSLDKKNKGLEGAGKEKGIRLLQEQNERILSGLPIGLVLFDKEGNTLKTNLAFLDLFSLRSEDVINKPPSSYLPDHISQRLEPILCDTLNEGRFIDSIEIEYRENQEQCKILGLKLIPILDTEGETENLLLLMENLTKNKVMGKEQQRIEKENSLLQLASGIAHEVRNPLSVIHGSIQYLHTIKGQGDDAITEHLNVMAESCELIESVINELVNFARPITMVFELMNINECLEKTVSLLKYRCQKRNIGLRLELDPALPLIACDEQHIGQVFINLIINAVQSMPKGGKLTIYTKDDPLHQRIQIIFQDSGTGI